MYRSGASSASGARVVKPPHPHPPRHQPVATGNRPHTSSPNSRSSAAPPTESAGADAGAEDGRAVGEKEVESRSSASCTARRRKSGDSIVWEGGVSGGLVSQVVRVKGGGGGREGGRRRRSRRRETGREVGESRHKDDKMTGREGRVVSTGTKGSKAALASVVRLSGERGRGRAGEGRRRKWGAAGRKRGKMEGGGKWRQELGRTERRLDMGGLSPLALCAKASHTRRCLPKAKHKDNENSPRPHPRAHTAFARNTRTRGTYAARACAVRVFSAVSAAPPLPPPPVSSAGVPGPATGAHGRVVARPCAAAGSKSSSSEELRRERGRRKRRAEPPVAPDALASLVREGPAARPAWGGGGESSSNAKGRDEARIGLGTGAADVAPDPTFHPMTIRKRWDGHTRRLETRRWEGSEGGVAPGEGRNGWDRPRFIGWDGRQRREELAGRACDKIVIKMEEKIAEAK
ncbi:hypothetical protein B0H14DRAFT_2570069 [Mycena olivaceomarginata]|nr:hypothetical protein B0H14DRAFT_2570069 [Mycena olivaceomarginata]